MSFLNELPDTSSKSSSEEYLALEALDRLYGIALQSLRHGLSENQNDQSAALLGKCIYRLEDHIKALVTIHTRNFYGAAEALSRVIVEASINICFLCLGDRMDRFNQYFAGYIQSERKQNRQWRECCSGLNDRARALQETQITKKDDALNYLEGFLISIYQEIGKTPYNSAAQWPSAFDRFAALQKQIDYRTTYAAMSSQIHNDAEDLLNEYLTGCIPTGEEVIDAMEAKKRSFSKSLFLTAIYQAGFSFGFIAATFKNDALIQQSVSSLEKLGMIVDAYAGEEMNR